MDTDQKISKVDRERHESLKRLSKRLAYLLRYGACKEGLLVDNNGYVNLDDLMTVGLLKEYSKVEILTVVKTSISYRKVSRYEWKEQDGCMLIRAAYLRNFEKNPYHFGTKVKTLYETATLCVLDHLEHFDLQDFIDENIIRDFIRRLKRQKKLNRKELEILLVPAVTHLDLEGVFLNNKILSTIWTQCPNLVAVSLKDCGYIITDTVLNKFTQNLPKLERLNLCSCTHLTSKCMSILRNNLVHLKVLHIGNISSLTYAAVKKFIENSNSIKFLDVFYLRTTAVEYTSLMKLSLQKEVELILKEPKVKVEADVNGIKTDVENSSGWLRQ